MLVFKNFGFCPNQTLLMTQKIKHITKIPFLFSKRRYFHHEDIAVLRKKKMSILQAFSKYLYIPPIL